ncbi:MAG TPA: Stk1 family PASTA domain-containing Ser/Thr kinase [Pseudogracilibacillus sp.]|nr:Stk1 family PASTA domain-containing Ser/Thr kinase [Pseudogracilibacillus sp.]
MLAGHLLSERYQIKRMIGGGGMANVYLAYDEILSREVAIKVLRPEYANDPEFIERFDREAQAATSLSHPNIVNIYDVGEEEDILYIVMEYVRGRTLKEYIQQQGAVDVVEAVEIMKQLTNAIGQAHVSGLIHRDIKPQNILMDDHGNVKITDFGIAIALSATALTQTNSILGSVHYLSPEQARGGMATKKSDIYALGIVFFELLTGQLPFFGQSPVSIALKHLHEEVPSVRKIQENIPQSIENIVRKATTKDPFHRYENVFTMEEALALSLNPANKDEPLYSPPVEEGEETKTIPVFPGSNLQQEEEETFVHNEEKDTKSFTADADQAASDKTVKKKKPFFKRKGFYIILLLLALLIGAAVYFYIASNPKDVLVPDVTEETYDEAKDTLEELDLVVEKKMAPSDTIEEDSVIKTDPKAGKTVKEEDSITVFVSNGKEKINFDDYIGDEFGQVKRLLEDEGYKEVISYPKNSDQPEGQILEQIQPLEGEEVVPEETKVIFEISEGPETFSLNRLEGLTEEEAQEYIDDHGLTLSTTEEYSDTVDEGDIIKQSPEANEDVTAGTEVEVDVSKGPEKTTQSQTVSFDVPFEPEDDEEEQTVKVYVKDKNYSMDDVFEEDTIKEDQDYELKLAIDPDETAEYKVERDGETIKEEKVDYKEEDGD